MGLPEDPRRLNCQFNLETIEAHVKAYADALSTALLSIDWRQLDLAIAEIESVRMRGRGFGWRETAGRLRLLTICCATGSRAPSSPSQTPIHVHSLVSNTALLTACANDFGYEVSFCAPDRDAGSTRRHCDLHLFVGKQRKHFGGVASGQLHGVEDYRSHWVQWRRGGKAGRHQPPRRCSQLWYRRRLPSNSDAQHRAIYLWPFGPGTLDVASGHSGGRAGHTAWRAYADDP